jgi:hypothetical protein
MEKIMKRNETQDLYNISFEWWQDIETERQIKENR